MSVAGADSLPAESTAITWVGFEDARIAIEDRAVCTDQAVIQEKDISLLKAGILHTYIRHDRNITILGILTIALTFLGSGIVTLSTMLDSTIQTPWFLLASRILRAVAIAIVITMLFDTFLMVASYYLDRSRVILERDLVVDILDREYNKYQTAGSKSIPPKGEAPKHGKQSGKKPPPASK